jgi:hypothetical protein
VKRAPGRCLAGAICVAVLLLVALVFGRRAQAEPPRKKDLPDSREERAVGGGSTGSARRGGTGTSPPREKTYTFGGLDIDGKLRTPQLLYFLNRMKSELDTTTPDKRSFIPELRRSTEEM